MVNPVTGTGGARQTSSSTAPSTPTPTPTTARARGVQYQVEPGSTASQQRLQTVFATLGLNRQRREAGQTPVPIPPAEITPPQPSALSQLLLGAASATATAASVYLVGSATRGQLAAQEDCAVATTSPPLIRAGEAETQALVTRAPAEGLIKATTLESTNSVIEPSQPHTGTIMIVAEQGGEGKRMDSVNIHHRGRRWLSSMWACTDSLPHDLIFEVQTKTEEWLVTDMRLCIWNDNHEFWTPSTGRGGRASVKLPAGTKLPLKIEGKMNIFGWEWHGPYPTRQRATLSSVDCRAKVLSFEIQGAYYKKYSYLKNIPT